MSKRHVAAACLWGVAAGAIAYRYGMLPFAWSSPLKHLLPGAAIGLAVAAHHLVRDTDAKRPPLAALVGLGVLGALAAFGLSYLAFPTLSRVALEQREMPGFSIALPAGDVVENNVDYTQGKLTMKNVGHAGGVLVMQWEPGEAMTGDELKLVADVIVKVLGTKGAANADARTASVPGPGGKPAQSIVFGGDNVSFVLSELHCGTRQILVATGAAADTMSLQRRILASFACHPDPAKETTAIAFPLVFELPGWFASEREPDQIQITDGKTANLTMRTIASHEKLDLEPIIEPMFKAAGLGVKITKRDGDRFSLAMSDGSDSMPGWAQLFPCPTGTALVLAIGEDEATLDQLHATVKGGRCLRPGEKPQQWPDPPAGFKLPE